MAYKIAYIVHSLNPGGTERLALDMAKAFAREYGVVILCLDEPGLWAKDARKNNIPVHCLFRQPGIDLSLPFKLATFARQEKVDLFHAHQYTPWFYAGLARLIYPRTKLLFEEHGRHYPEKKNPKRKWFNQILLQNLTTVATAVSKDIKNRLMLYEGIAEDKIQVIYNGANPVTHYSDSEKQALRHSFGFGRDDVVLGTMGRLDPIKNLPLFLDGFGAVKKSCPRLKGLIVGDGPLMLDLKESIKARGLEKDIKLAGFRPDAARLVQIMDVFSLVSFSEGTSMALLEAMASGIPAIVTRVGGNPEIIKDKKSGWLVPSNDLPSFTTALTQAVMETDTRKQLGLGAREQFDEGFQFNTMIKAYDRLYGRLSGGC